MVADHAPDAAELRQQAQALAHLLAAAADRLEVVVSSGSSRKIALDLLVDRRGQQRERLGRRLLGAEVRVGRVAAEQRVHLARHLAEPAQARRGSLRSSPHRVERELPAVAAVRDEALQDPERRVHRAAGVRVPARELRDVLEAVLGQEAQQLELGVDARLEAAEDLQDQLLVEDDRGVRLLDADRARLAQLLPSPAEPPDRRELDDALAGGQLGAAADHVDELAHLAGIAERVEAAVREQLVRLVRPGVEAHLDELQLERGIGLAQHRAVDHRGVRDMARLRAEPALAGDEVDQGLLVDGHPSSSFRSWNQKNPRGPKRQQVRQLADPRERGLAEHLLRHEPLPPRQVELDRLRRAREVVDAEHDVVLVRAHVGEDPRVVGPQRLVRAEPEDADAACAARSGGAASAAASSAGAAAPRR